MRQPWINKVFFFFFFFFCLNRVCILLENPEVQDIDYISEGLVHHALSSYFQGNIYIYMYLHDMDDMVVSPLDDLFISLTVV